MPLRRRLPPAQGLLRAAAEAGPRARPNRGCLPEYGQCAGEQQSQRERAEEKRRRSGTRRECPKPRRSRAICAAYKPPYCAALGGVLSWSLWRSPLWRKRFGSVRCGFSALVFAFEAVWHASRAVDGRGVRLYKLWARVNLGRENAHRVGRLTGLKGGMVSDGAGNYRKKTLRISLLAELWRASILWFDMLRSPPR